MKTAFRFCVLGTAVLAFSLGLVSAAAARDGSGQRDTEGEYAGLHAAAKRDEQNLLRFSGLLERLDAAAKESNNAHREGVVGEIISEMDQEIRQVHHKLDKTYFLPDEVVVAVREGGEHAVMLTRARARLIAREELCRVCTEIQEPAIDKEKRELKMFKQKSREFYELLREELRATQSLLPAGYLEAGTVNSN
ncbi:MAG: hypothetical protein P8181_05435 [bacterium]